MFSLDSTPPKPVRTVFVRASDQFTVRTVAAGRYELRYRDLDSGALYRTDPFSIDTEGAKHNALPITLDDPNELSTHTHPISDRGFLRASIHPVTLLVATARSPVRALSSRRIIAWSEHGLSCPGTTGSLCAGTTGACGSPRSR